jgi:hypothetical protein
MSRVKAVFVFLEIQVHVHSCLALVQDLDGYMIESSQQTI